MGNFASSSEWVQPSEEARARRSTIMPCASLPVVAPNSMGKTRRSDIISFLVARAMTTCKQSISRVFMNAIDNFICATEVTDDSTCDEENAMDDIFNEFQIVYENNYAPKTNRAHTEYNAINQFEATPWFQYSPSDCDTFQTVSAVNWNTCKVQHDDDCRSATTESTEWLSDNDDTKSENPAASTCSELDDLDFYDESDDVETKATRLLRLASTMGEENLLFVDDYICNCGKCPVYETIEDDVARLLTWYGPEELLSITRIVQAFSTYNETIAYHPDMIATADELLQIWNGDEDQAFSSFVVLHDDVPFLCENPVCISFIKQSLFS